MSCFWTGFSVHIRMAVSTQAARLPISGAIPPLTASVVLLHPLWGATAPPLVKSWFGSGETPYGVKKGRSWQVMSLTKGPAGKGRGKYRLSP